MEIKNSGKSSSSVSIREMVQIALLTALTYISVAFLNIEYVNNNVLHLGDSIIFIAAILFGRKHAALSGAFGMALFDLLSGAYAFWTPYTFVIKGVMGFIAGTIAFSGNAKGNNWIRNIIGMIAAGVWMVAGYFMAEAIITGNFAAPLVAVHGNIIQAVSGAVIAFALVTALRKTNYFNR